MFTENHELAAKLEASAAHDWERFTTKHTCYPLQTELERLKAASIAINAQLLTAWRIAYANPDTHTPLWDEVTALRKKSFAAYAAWNAARKAATTGGAL